MRIVFGIMLPVCVAWSPLAMAATQQEKRAAIEKGLAYLHHTQNAAGYWSCPGCEQAATGAAAYAFLSQRDKWGSNAGLYQAAADRALGYLLGTASVVGVSNRSDGAVICPDGAAVCKAVYWNGNAEPTYTTGLVVPVIAAYGVAAGADAVATRAGPLQGMTWRQIAQGITNAIAANQTTARTNGGWRFSDIAEAASDTSATQWAVSSLLYAEMLGSATPASIKETLRTWLGNIQIASGVTDDRPFGAEPSAYADTGGLLLAMRFAGYDRANSQMQAALGFLNRSWQSTANNVPFGNFGNPYAMWAVYRGLQAAIGLDDATGITNFLTGCGLQANESLAAGSGSAGCTWYGDYSEWLVKNQNRDGSWSGYSRWTGPLETALYTSILGAAQLPPGAYACPLSREFWANMPGLWPVASLKIGNETYTKPELLNILGISGSPDAVADASVILGGELIAAKLNLAHVSDPGPAAVAIAEAEGALAQPYGGKLPHYAARLSPAGQRMEAIAEALANYNSGSLTAGCMIAAELPAAAQEPALRRPRRQYSAASATAAGTSGSISRMASVHQSTAAPNKGRLRPYVRRGVTGLSINRSGTAVASLGGDFRIRIWNAATGLQQQVCPSLPAQPAGLAFNQSDDTVWSVGRDSLVRVWDAAVASELAALGGHEHPIRAIAASADGRFLASAGEETRILLWDLVNRKLIRVFSGPRNFINALSFSPDGRLLAAAGEDARVLIFDVATGSVVHTLRGHSGALDAVAFSRDGTALVSGGQDTVIRLWDAASGLQRQALAGHSAPIRSVAFSPDGQLIASGGEDTRIILWDVPTGAIEKILSGSTSMINVLAFGPLKGPPFLASATDDGQITIWNMPAGKELWTVKVPQN